MSNVVLANKLQWLSIHPDVENVFEDFIVHYIKDRPSLLNACIEQEGLYHVFAREEDPTELDNIESSDICYLRTFTTEKDAELWIKRFGRDIICDKETTDNTPFVLIICHLNKSGDYVDEEISQTCMSGISSRKHPTFCFSKKGYKMCLREHLLSNVDLIPYWITYIPACGVIRGCEIEHIIKIHKRRRITDNEEIQRDYDDYYKFTDDPDDYIRNKRLSNL